MGDTLLSPFGILFPGLTQHWCRSELYEGLLAMLLFGVLLCPSQRTLIRVPYS